MNLEHCLLLVQLAESNNIVSLRFVTVSMARVKRDSRKRTGGKAPRKTLKTKVSTRKTKTTSVCSNDEHFNGRKRRKLISHSCAKSHSTDSSSNTGPGSVGMVNSSVLLLGRAQFKVSSTTFDVEGKGFKPFYIINSHLL